MKIKFLMPFAAALLLSGFPLKSFGDDLVIIHTNDTHSQLDPDDETDLGGIGRRKVLIDSIRKAHDNVMLVDAGDVVQGSLYFNLHHGEIENKLMDKLGYDLRILGNHEFDDGMEMLKKNIIDTKSQWLSTNYKFADPELAGKFSPFTIRNFDGKRIGFIALNLEPKGMISEGNYDGVEYVDPYKAANATAWALKNLDSCDVVVALTHIGYLPTGTGTSDLQLATNSRDIDVIIGGHSHTTIDPAAKDPRKPWLVPNADGRMILVTQTGKSGKNIGEVTINLDDLTSSYKLIPVTSRLDDRIDDDIVEMIAPYKAGVDSLMTLKVAESAVAMAKDSNELLNFLSDYMAVRGKQLAGKKIDFGMVNVGGVRRGLPKGDISEGQILMMLPFNNKIEVLEIKGKDLLENFDVMARDGSASVSAEVEAVYDPLTHKCTGVFIAGKPVDPNKTYYMATIDYLANGGDYMTPLTRAKKVAVSPNKFSTDFLDYLRKNYKGKVINPSSVQRIHPAQ
ncbi:MAG: bifunctional UDP-sugar hydrolase/5'-nucleotidase [Bacteroidales bacterium]|nr:bifunctional UDP-sugar hydrolase/5'-nucleotidase [Bacteroidales bacterium]